MIREILFRGKDKEGSWVEGLLFYSHGLGEWKITHSNGWTPSYSNPDEGESTVHTSIDYNTISQYINQLDRQGNKVFEGDIFIDQTVTWCEESSSFYLKDKYNSDYDSNFKDLHLREITGNIHDIKEV